VSEAADYDIRHPEQVLGARDSAIIGLEGGSQQDFYETTVRVNLLHIVRLTPLRVSGALGNGQ
jgi:hypothetical protein